MTTPDTLWEREWIWYAHTGTHIHHHYSQNYVLVLFLLLFFLAYLYWFLNYEKNRVSFYFIFINFLSCFEINVYIYSYSHVKFIYIFLLSPEISPGWLELFVLVSMAMVYILVLLQKYRNLIWLLHLGEFFSTHYFQIKKCPILLLLFFYWQKSTKHILWNRLK